ncbi:hypothetical protein GYMLUDRAFT_44451, partial [Collybiopsis luxurians FD-317 M1]
MLSQTSRRISSQWQSFSRKASAAYTKTFNNQTISPIIRNHGLRAEPKPSILSLSRYNINSPSLCRQYTQSAQSKSTEPVKGEEAGTEEPAGTLDPYSAKIFHDILQRVKQVWPAPTVPIPEGWSANWEEWDMFLSVYWTSTEYLMLPQIEMVFNIFYGISGETRPIVFSDGAFIFTPVDRPSEFYLLEYDDGSRVFKLSSSLGTPLTESSVVELLGTPGKIVFEALEPSKEGTLALQRIIARDRSVIPELEKFLGYIPEHTELWEQHPGLDKEKLENMTEDEQLAEVQRLMAEIESRSPEFKNASEAWDNDMQRTDVSEGEVDPESVEHNVNALGLKDEVRELESMMDDASGELKKLDETFGSKSTGPSTDKTATDTSYGSLNVEVDEGDKDHVRLSVPFKEEQDEKEKKTK